MQIIRDKLELRQALRPYRESLALVPTMGALHRGHLSLVQSSQQQKTVVSIYVNPLQFGENEDFATYPRTVEQDCAQLEGLADFIYLPDQQAMYPAPQEVTIKLPMVAGELCGKSRPGFFEGVAVVVSKLINQVSPSHIYFGEKDFQQMHLMQKMIDQLNIPTTLVACPTVRESDGLAMSSRNRYLTPPERALAPHLYAHLQQLAQQIRAGNTDWRALENATTAALNALSFTVDYISIRDSKTLLPLPSYPASTEPATGEIIVLGAAMLGKARLIDNIRVNIR